MLEQICDFIHNYFERDRIEGTFTISGGAIALPLLLHGQRFRILGSLLNDGIYTYTDQHILASDGETYADLQDETFTGAIVAMAVPRGLLNLAQEIKTWCEKNAETLNSPYNSEAFGGYSYSKSGSSTGGAYTWQDQFKARLNAYRKIA